MVALALVDVKRILDESARGKKGSARLKALWQQKKGEYDRTAKKPGSKPGELAQLDQQMQQDLGKLREQMIDSVLEAARPIVDALIAERNLDLVLDSTAAFRVKSRELDLTDEVIRRMDAAP